MKQMYPDLWQTSAEHPLPAFPDTTCNAFLLVRPAGNVLFYCTGREAIGPVRDDADLNRIDELGGVDQILLGHWHEASASLRKIKDRFGSKVTCQARDAAPVAKQGAVTPDLTYWDRRMLFDDIEAIPTPGHTVGSACYLVRSAQSKHYLFTGDTIWHGRDGWTSVTFEDDSRQSSHRDSLDILAALDPDVVLSAVAPMNAVTEVDATQWKIAIEAAKGRLG